MSSRSAFNIGTAVTKARSWFERRSVGSRRGGTGDLGSRVVQSLLDQGTRTKMLVRRGVRRDRLPHGVEVAEVDFTQEHLLQAALQGASCVVSAVNGLDDVVIELQSRLLDGAVRAEVQRFIPSDFALDFKHA